MTEHVKVMGPQYHQCQLKTGHRTYTGLWKHNLIYI